MTNSQFTKGEVFKKLHKSPALFVLPNAWDTNSAKLLTNMGFSSLAAAFVGGEDAVRKPGKEGIVTNRDQTLASISKIVSATGLPVTANLGNGFGDRPENCMETIMLASEAGLVGVSIGDSSGKPHRPVYDYIHAVERIIASVDAARNLPFDFTLTASTENYEHGRFDLDDTIKRLVAYANAGADVLFAPGVKTKTDLAEIINALHPRPVNVAMDFSGADLTIDKALELGIRRISVGSSFAKAVLGDFYSEALRWKEKEIGK
ncbi:isocitrate lyase/phosphoenolpyruvate mutase family protein [Dyadobacter sp. CY356]|uniref:isocitrate lyase/PEP mutase family protein n=1 Tax=Dyadobacter sp. CY356 TaxID=2906442 RepID=UPI001F352AF0|nr:isocitrate lyase/phosphoenolpyruvate mutase family protein [Dyadobacter sp. CY356]